MRQFAAWSALICLLLFQASASAVDEYYSIARSVRALGMGGAFYALSDDEYAIFYNPSGTALYPGSSQFYFSFGGEAASDTVSGASTISNAFQHSTAGAIADSLSSLAGKPLYAGGTAFASFLTRGFEIGLLLASAKADIAVLGNGLGTQLDVTGIVDSGLFVNKSFRVVNNLYAGVTAKLLARGGGWQNFTPLNIVTGQTIELRNMGGAGLGADADLGFTYLFGPPAARVSGGTALSFNNLVATTYNLWQASGAGSPPELPRMVSAGGFLIWKPGRFIDNVRFLLDLSEFNIGGQSSENLGQRAGSFWKHVDFGVEIPFGGWFALRGGFHQGDYTAGLGVNLRAVRIDFATYAEELDSAPGRLTSRRYALEIAIGFGAPPTGATPNPGASANGGRS